ncbi:hypothetical protein ACTG9Q_24625 [Actinokineospora sp. 24-640]
MTTPTGIPYQQLHEQAHRTGVEAARAAGWDHSSGSVYVMLSNGGYLDWCKANDLQVVNSNCLVVRLPTDELDWPATAHQSYTPQVRYGSAYVAVLSDNGVGAAVTKGSD